MDRGKRIIGIFLIAVSIAALAAWEKWGKVQMLYDEVLVCRENVTRGTVMRGDMFETVKMDLTEKDWIPPSEQSKLVGKEAASFIHKGMPLFPQYFEHAELSAGGKEDRFVLTVPEDWLEALPTSVNRGDRAFFFSGSRLLTSAPVSGINREEGSVEVIVTERQAAELSGAAAAPGRLVMVYH